MRRLPPRGVQPAGALQALQRGQQRAGIDLEGAAGDLLDAARDAEAVQGRQAQRLEDQQVQGALDDVRVGAVYSGTVRPLILIVKM